MSTQLHDITEPNTSAIVEAATDKRRPAAEEASAVLDVENDGPTSPKIGDPQRRVASVVRWFTGTLPTALVILTLIGIAFWGHQYGWKMPKFSELTGNSPVEGVAWCEEHGVPEAECIACNADLMPKDKLHGWCKEHGVHECPLHHPEVAQLKETPKVAQADLGRAARAIALRPRSKNDSACKNHLRRIQFPSKAAAAKAGVDIDLVHRGRVVETISATGEIVYDPTRVARLSSRAAGTVWRVQKNVGDRVEKGDVLALVDAAEVGRIKAELLQAMSQLDYQTKTHERLKGLEAEGVVPGARLLEAETAKVNAQVAVQKAVQTLVNLGLFVTYEELRQTSAPLTEKVQFLGLPPEITKALDAARTTSNLIPVVAPRGGVVVRRDIVAGEVIRSSRILFTVADTTQVWLMLNVPLEEAKYVTIGQKVEFKADGSDDLTDTGTVTWISTDVDQESRTVMVRAELPNEDGRLRNETFGSGKIVLREEQEAIVVPSNAIHWEGCCFVAFVQDKDYHKPGGYRVFHTRSVRPGVQMGDYTEVIAGLLPDEVIVKKGSGVLRAELLKGNLGAG